MTMPLIEVHLIENVFDSTQKKQITDAMVSIEGENMRNVTWVKISEVAGGANKGRAIARSNADNGAEERMGGSFGHMPSGEVESSCG
jgi:hypothetical protein